MKIQLLERNIKMIQRVCRKAEKQLEKVIQWPANI